GEQLAGTAETGLNLVENQNDLVASTNLAHGFEITGGRNYHPRLALDGLDQESDRVGRDRCFERGGVSQRYNAAEAGREGAEAVARGRIGAEADDRESAAVEIVRADDDFGPVLWHTFDFIAPFACNLDRAFHSFGARVHWQNPV